MVQNRFSFQGEVGVCIYPSKCHEGISANQFAELVRACAPALQNLISETGREPELPLFGARTDNDAESFFGASTMARLGPRAKKAAEDALELYRYLEKKTDTTSLAPVFNTLLGSFDEAAKAFILKLLQPKVPINRPDQQRWFEPDLMAVPHREVRHFQNMGASLKRALVYGSVHSAIGLARSCLDHAIQGNPPLKGVFAGVREAFSIPDASGHLKRVSDVNDFRNTYVAHHEKPLTDRSVAEANLKAWVTTLSLLRA